MPRTTEQNGAMRPVLNLFYVLDSSGSMSGDPITVLNRAMRSTIDAVKMEAAYNNQARIKVAVLTFNSTCWWLNEYGPEDIDRFIFDDLQATGVTCMGAALAELNSKLSSRGFINAESGNLMPVIIFMTDGYPTDEYKPELEKIMRNKWFSKATRIGFAIGGNPDQEMIARLVGNSESVIRTKNLGDFAALLRWVSVTSSMLQSESRVTGWESIGVDAVNEAKRRAGYDESSFRPDFDYREERRDDGSWGPDPLSVSDDDYGIGAEW